MVVFKPVVEFTHDDFSTVMATNLEAAFHLSQLAHPLLKASGSGCVVIISSIVGTLAIPVQVSIYAASKAALIQLTKNLACESAKDGIRANTIAPGTIRTQMFYQSANSEEAEAQFLRQIPLDALESQRSSPLLQHFAACLLLLILLANSFLWMAVIVFVVISSLLMA